MEKLTNYKTTVLKIKLVTPEDVQEFISLAEQLKDGVIQISQGFNVVSGKSLMEFLSTIDFLKPQLLTIQGEHSGEYADKFKKWKVENSN